MKAQGYQTIFVVVLLNINIFGVFGDVDESNEESQPNYEYIQIFKSIPALFEYLLDALEERPEILEKNDVTMFKRTIDIAETDECNSDNDKKTDKRDADCDNTDDSNKLDKRNAVNSKDVSETTVAYEYGNSNVIMKNLDEIERDKPVSKRFANNDNYNKFADNKELLNKESRIYSRKKRNVVSKLDDEINDMFRNYGDVFLGFEHLFGLDLNPEEIEERILTAEKLLEEHNNKRDEK